MVDKKTIHKGLCDLLHNTYLQKNEAYGDSFGKCFKDFGIISAMTRMSDKWNRLVALTNGAKNDVKDESINDTLLDLANYCLMTAIEIELKE